MKEYKRLKPGQLCTVGNHIYRATKCPDDGFYPVCVHCRNTNKDKLLCTQSEAGADATTCIMLFGTRDYPKLVK